MSPPATSLRELIEQAKLKHDTDSIRALSRIGRERGGTLSHGILNSIYNGDYKARPTRETLQEIADLAGVSYETAHEAAGLGKPHRPFARQLPERVDELTPEHREVVLVVVRALLKAQGDESALEDSEAPPATAVLADDETEDAIRARLEAEVPQLESRSVVDLRKRG